jgi:hypothetical protein
MTTLRTKEKTICPQTAPRHGNIHQPSQSLFVEFVSHYPPSMFWLLFDAREMIKGCLAGGFWDRNRQWVRPFNPPSQNKRSFGTSSECRSVCQATQAFTPHIMSISISGASHAVFNIAQLFLGSWSNFATLSQEPRRRHD